MDESRNIVIVSFLRWLLCQRGIASLSREAFEMNGVIRKRSAIRVAINEFSNTVPSSRNASPSAYEERCVLFIGSHDGIHDDKNVGFIDQKPSWEGYCRVSIGKSELTRAKSWTDFAFGMILWSIVGFVSCIRLNRKSGFWKFPSHFFSVLNVIDIQRRSNCKIVWANIDEPLSLFVLRYLEKNIVALSSPSPLHINIPNLVCTDIIVTNSWQKEEILASASIIVHGDVFVRAQPPVISWFKGPKIGGVLYIVSSGHWLRRKLNHIGSERLAVLGALEERILNYFCTQSPVKDLVKILVHPRELAHFKMTEAYYEHFGYRRSFETLDRAVKELNRNDVLIGGMSTSFNSLFKIAAEDDNDLTVRMGVEGYVLKHLSKTSIRSFIFDASNEEEWSLLVRLVEQKLCGS